MNFQHIAQARSQQPAGRHLPLFAVGTNALHRRIGTAIHFLPVHVEVVAGNAMQRWDAAGVDTRMSHSGYGGHVIDHRVFKTIALVHEASQAIGTELVVEIIQVVPAHLVYHKPHHKLWSADFGHAGNHKHGG